MMYNLIETNRSTIIAHTIVQLFFD